MFRLSGGIQSDRYSLPLRFSGRDFSANVLADRLAALSLTEWHLHPLSMPRSASSVPPLLVRQREPKR